MLRKTNNCGRGMRARQRKQQLVAMAAIGLTLILTSSVSAVPVSGTFSPATFSESQEPAGAMMGVFITGFGQSNFGHIKQAETDANGFFQLDLSPGTWNISANPFDAADRGFIHADRRIDVREGVPQEPILIEGIQGTITIQGSIKTAEGTPLPNVFVFGGSWLDDQLYAVSATSDFSGGFVMRVFPGSWNVSPGSVAGLSKIPDQLIEVSEDASIEFVSQVAPASLAIVPDALPDGMAGSPYRTTLEIGDESTLVQWSLDAASAALPAGISLNPILGTLSGTPIVNGEFEFSVVATERFGSRSGRKTFSLSLGEDMTPPRIVSSSPGRSSSLVRNDSVLAIRFSEPMRRFQVDERPDIRWVFGAGGLSEVIDPSELIIRWNDTSDTAFIYLEEPFKLGPHTWSLNSTPEVLPVRTLFRDASGNPLAQTSDHRIIVTHLESDGLPAGSSLERAPAVDTIWLLKDQVIADSSGASRFGLARFYTTVSLPEFTWNTVKQATLLTPKQESKPLSRSIFPESNGLHLDGVLSSFDSEFAEFPDGTYQIDLDTFRDGSQSLALELSGDQYPPAAQLLQRCESLHIPSSRPFLLRLAGVPSDGIDRTELIISERSFPQLHRGPLVRDLVFRSILMDGETQFEIPAHTFAPEREYFAIIRHYRFVDENLSYGGVIARSGLVTTTELKLATRLPSLACPQANDGNLFVTQLGGLNEAMQAVGRGELLFPNARVITQSEASIIQFGLGSTIELHAHSQGQLDASGSMGGNIIFHLDAGGVTIAMDSRDADVFGFEMRTDAGTVVAESGRSVILHEGDSQVTSITVVEGEARVLESGFPGESQKLVAGNGIQIRPPAVPEPATGLPELRIGADSAGGLLLSWDKAYRGWQLYSRSILGGSAEWVRYDEAIVESDSDFEARVLGDGDSRFYQLVQDSPDSE